MEFNIISDKLKILDKKRIDRRRADLIKNVRVDVIFSQVSGDLGGRSISKNKFAVK
jgi:hypothetical protein